MIARCAVLIGLFAVAIAARASLDSPREMTTAEALDQFPRAIGAWRGEDVPLDPQVIKVAAVSDHLNRQYSSAGGSGVSLYIGYYRSQRQGESLHSPLFCMPGTGWQPIKTETTSVRLGNDPRIVNAIVVERGLTRLLVLYWYQTVARVTASEYWRKFFLMHDAFFAGRTDVALVRIVAPIAHQEAASEAASADVARPFAELVLPEVQQRLFRPMVAE
jgi:EpsI family protein